MNSTEFNISIIKAAQNASRPVSLDNVISASQPNSRSKPITRMIVHTLRGNQYPTILLEVNPSKRAEVSMRKKGLTSNKYAAGDLSYVNGKIVLPIVIKHPKHAKVWVLKDIRDDEYDSDINNLSKEFNLQPHHKSGLKATIQERVVKIIEAIFAKSNLSTATVVNVINKKKEIIRGAVDLMREILRSLKRIMKENDKSKVMKKNNAARLITRAVVKPSAANALGRTVTRPLLTVTYFQLIDNIRTPMMTLLNILYKGATPAIGSDYELYLGTHILPNAVLSSIHGNANMRNTILSSDISTIYPGMNIDGVQKELTNAYGVDAKTVRFGNSKKITLTLENKIAPIFDWVNEIGAAPIIILISDYITFMRINTIQLDELARAFDNVRLDESNNANSILPKLRSCLSPGQVGQMRRYIADTDDANEAAMRKYLVIALGRALEDTNRIVRPSMMDVNGDTRPPLPKEDQLAVLRSQFSHVAEQLKERVINKIAKLDPEKIEEFVKALDVEDLRILYTGSQFHKYRDLLRKIYLCLVGYYGMLNKMRNDDDSAFTENSLSVFEFFLGKYDWTMKQMYEIAGLSNIRRNVNARRMANILNVFDNRLLSIPVSSAKDASYAAIVPLVPCPSAGNITRCIEDAQDPDAVHTRAFMHIFQGNLAHFTRIGGRRPGRIQTLLVPTAADGSLLIAPPLLRGLISPSRLADRIKNVSNNKNAKSLGPFNIKFLSASGNYVLGNRNVNLRNATTYIRSTSSLIKKSANNIKFNKNSKQIIEVPPGIPKAIFGLGLSSEKKQRTLCFELFFSIMGEKLMKLNTRGDSYEFSDRVKVEILVNGRRYAGENSAQKDAWTQHIRNFVLGYMLAHAGPRTRRSQHYEIITHDPPYTNESYLNAITNAREKLIGDPDPDPNGFVAADRLFQFDLRSISEVRKKFGVEFFERLVANTPDLLTLCSDQVKKVHNRVYESQDTPLQHKIMMHRLDKYVRTKMGYPKMKVYRNIRDVLLNYEPVHRMLDALELLNANNNEIKVMLNWHKSNPAVITRNQINTALRDNYISLKSQAIRNAYERYRRGANTIDRSMDTPGTPAHSRLQQILSIGNTPLLTPRWTTETPLGRGNRGTTNNPGRIFRKYRALVFIRDTPEPYQLSGMYDHLR